MLYFTETTDLKIRIQRMLHRGYDLRGSQWETSSLKLAMKAAARAETEEGAGYEARRTTRILWIR